MIAIETYAHVSTPEKEECLGVFRVGRYKRTRDLAIYRLPGDVWRMTKNNIEVKIKAA